MTKPPVPYTVLGGYLGAGKTTLLNQLLRDNAGARLAVIVNDFGDIGIDAELIANQDGDTINLTNGCICCSASDGLATVLDDLRTRADGIDHVIVEASGVSDPARIGHYAGPFGFELRGVIVLADAEQVRSRSTDKYVGDTVISQLCGADMIVLTKIDLVDQSQLAEVRVWLGETAPGTPILQATNGHCPHGRGARRHQADAGDTKHRPRSSRRLRHVEPRVRRPDRPIDPRGVHQSIARGSAPREGIRPPRPEIPTTATSSRSSGRRVSLTRDAEWIAGGEPHTRLVVIATTGTLDHDRLAASMSA